MEIEIEDEDREPTVTVQELIDLLLAIEDKSIIVHVDGQRADGIEIYDDGDINIYSNPDW